MSENRERVIEALLTRAGWPGAERRPLAGDASFRRYDRVHKDGRTAVLMDAPPPKEDVRPFVRLAMHLGRMGYSAPALLGVDLEEGLLLLEDLGDGTYTKLLADGADEEALYALAVDFLADLHGRTDAIPLGIGGYDEGRLLTEARLLTDWYMPAVLGRDTDAADRAAFDHQWRKVIATAQAVPETLVLRDFHVDNLLLLPRGGVAACGLLDFQDAVAGPVTYDLMSLLEDARRDIDPGLIGRMKDRYLAHFPHLNHEAFAASWAVLAAQRHAKVIGIFTRLAKRDGKPGYLVHIPRVWRLLENALAHPALAGVKDWLDHHIPAHHRIPPAS